MKNKILYSSGSSESSSEALSESSSESSSCTDSFSSSETNTKKNNKKIIPDTDTRLHNIVKQLDYNNIVAVRTVLDITLKKLEETQKELIYYQRECKVRDKVIEELHNDIKTLKTFEKSK